MRILLSSAYATPAAHDATLALADALVARGHHVVLATDRPTTGSPATVVPLPPRGSRLRSVRAALAIATALRRHRVQVLHAGSSTAERVAHLLAPMLRVPVVTAPIAASGAIDAIERACRSAYVAERRREVPILCYHRLVERDDEAGRFETHLRVDKFEAQLRYLQEHGYRTLHFAELDRAHVFEDGRKSVVLTFDDGYEDNYRLLFPLLKRYNAKAVIYLVSGRERNDWDIGEGERPLRLLTDAQRREMLESGLVEFGAHTVSHVDLGEAGEEEARREIVGSKQQLEASLGRRVETFAYPYGHLSEQAKAIVAAAGFRYALATNSGPVALHEDPFHVRRIVIFPGISLKRFARKVSGHYVQRPTVPVTPIAPITPRPQPVPTAVPPVPVVVRPALATPSMRTANGRATARRPVAAR